MRSLELRSVVATSAGALAPLRRDRRRSDRQDGVRDVTTAIDIGSKSWPFDIRLRPWVFRPHIGLLPLRYIAGGDVRRANHCDMSAISGPKVAEAPTPMNKCISANVNIF